ncbi:MAG: response regulator [Bacteroidetes bacterium]|nr:response regulator [Bacteroidota bacterium]
MNSYMNFNSKLGNILVVEDSPVQAKKIKFLLEENGLNVMVCPNGKLALEAIAEVHPLLIISDIVMPEMDGYEFCSILKNDVNFREIPVILLTSLHDPLDIIKGLQSGADNFITKPYDEKYLLSRIQYLLANRSIRQSGGAEMVIEIVFRGQKYAINSEKKQILDLLLSIYEAAIQKNDELIQAQAQLEALNEDLISKNKELEAFARTVSHDLRSPLSNVNGIVDLMVQDYSDILDDEARSLLSIIKTSALSMTHLIDDLLKFSQSAHASLEPVPVDLSSIAHQVIEKLRHTYPDRVVYEFIQEGLNVNADMGLMSIALDNLIGNAWKYTGNKSVAKIRLGSLIERGETIYYIQDNGAGFDMNKAGKLFKPFERLHTQQEFPGTGVGLATVQRIIERHGGRLWADSSVGRGATFYFTLP